MRQVTDRNAFAFLAPKALPLMRTAHSRTQPRTVSTQRSFRWIRPRLRDSFKASLGGPAFLWPVLCKSVAPTPRPPVSDELPPQEIRRRLFSQRNNPGLRLAAGIREWPFPPFFRADAGPGEQVLQTSSLGPSATSASC